MLSLNGKNDISIENNANSDVNIESRIIRNKLFHSILVLVQIILLIPHLRKKVPLCSFVSILFMPLIQHGLMFSFVMHNKRIIYVQKANNNIFEKKEMFPKTWKEFFVWELVFLSYTLPHRQEYAK